MVWLFVSTQLKEIKLQWIFFSVNDSAAFFENPSHKTPLRDFNGPLTNLPFQTFMYPKKNPIQSKQTKTPQTYTVFPTQTQHHHPRSITLGMRRDGDRVATLARLVARSTTGATSGLGNTTTTTTINPRGTASQKSGTSPLAASALFLVGVVGGNCWVGRFVAGWR